ncbi:MAG: HAD family phosphatase [Euryarchaeota archaeon]|nr:HAD family phosphatase [Euryarchaeota archaeon]
MVKATTVVCPHEYRTRRTRDVEREDPLRLVCFDMDGVLIHGGSSWVQVHRHFGVENDAALARFMAGEIDDEEFIRTDVALWTRDGPVHRSVLDQVLSAPQIMPGAGDTIAALHDAGIKTAIVSGGLDHMANRVAGLLGIDEVHANGLHYDADGHLTGEGILRTPLRDKSAPLRAVAAKTGVPYGRIAAIGDSCPDASMFESCGYGIAFNPADPCVRHAADVTVETTDLRDVLPHLL